MAKSDMPLSEAMKDLTGFELIAIEDHYKTSIDKLSGLRAMYGVIFALENRAKKTTWSEVQSLKLSEVEEYFPDEDDMDDAPLSETDNPSESPD